MTIKLLNIIESMYGCSTVPGLDVLNALLLGVMFTYVLHV